MSKRKKLTQKSLKELLHYDPETGIFKWRLRNRARRPDRTAGSSSSGGYIQVSVNGVLHQANRLAFLYMKGYFPENEVDHKDGIRANNIWKNLRHVTKLCNGQNCKTQTNNTSGFNGVSKQARSGKWITNIRLEDKLIYLGVYSNILDAALARLTFEVQCSKWTCNHRGELVKAIKKAWPEFNERSLV